VVDERFVYMTLPRFSLGNEALPHFFQVKPMTQQYVVEISCSLGIFYDVM